MRPLSDTTCLAALAVALLPAAASAQTLTIADARTAPVATATAVSGAPGNIEITSAGSIVPTAAGAAVTLNSANSVANAGTIRFTGVDGATAILATSAGGGITNTGTITVDESYTPTDGDNDGDIDGPFASGRDRYGIRVAGAFTGNVANSGTITIEGNASAGIAIDAPLTGTLTQGGRIAVTGDDSVGVRAGAVSGNVRIAGTISAQGARAQGAALTGDIGGALTVQGDISATGYRSATPPADASKLDADDLLQGGPAVSIAGNVAGGVVFAVPPVESNANSTDDDGDGIPDASEGRAVVTSYGAAPAVRIGAADRAVTIGAVAGDATRAGLVVDGGVVGRGAYGGVAATGLAIGGLGGAVGIANGLTVRGSVTAVANDAAATAISIGAGASVPAIVNTGTITAGGGGRAGTQNAALLVEAGAGVATITNSGAIGASSGGSEGASTAVLDRSGGVRSVVNTGAITATGGAAGRNVAIDLSAATAGTTVRQSAAADGRPAPAITGDIRFGRGDDTLDLGAGAITGAIAFGGGADGFAVGSGATFTGTWTGGEGVALSLAGGTIAYAGSGVAALRTLDVTGGGTLNATIDAATGATTLYRVSGAARFAPGSRIALQLTDVRQAVGDHVVVQAGSLTGGENIALASAGLPYMYKGAVAANAAAGTVTVAIARKTVPELGINGSEGRAWDAVYAAIGADKPVGDSFLGIADQAAFRAGVRAMLPDHAGGAFEGVTQASRATARMLADPDAPIVTSGRLGFWLQQVAWGRSRSISDVGGYRLSGWGVTGGGEYALGGFGRIGGSVAYMSGNDNDRGSANTLNSDHYEFALTWRGDWGGLHAFARGSVGLIDFGSERRFAGQAGAASVSRVAEGDWKGRLYAGAGGASYRLALGAFSVRPQVSVDYYRLDERRYQERGDAGYALSVASRDSDEFAVAGAVALGYALFDDREEEGGYLRFEIEGGRRQLVGGSLDATTARFAGGDAFTLLAANRTSGWTGAVRAKGGSQAFTLGGELNAEQQDGRAAIALRAGVQIAF